VKGIEPKTTIWKDGGLSLVKTIRGLPYGTSDTAFIEGLGKAVCSGIQKSGSGNNESIVEVKYTLK
jgi:hypothetical protein